MDCILTLANDTKEKMNVAVLGVGYVGLPTAVFLTSIGHSVYCSDQDEAKISTLQNGKAPIHEEGLLELLEVGVNAGRLRFTTSNANVVIGASVVFLCLPTPQKMDGYADVSCIEEVAREISEHLESNAIVVIKSTVPVGESEAIKALINRRDIDVVSNPEFLREGYAIYDSFHPERIVVGSNNPVAAKRVASLFELPDAPLILTDNITAETIKYASNAFLAAKLSFVNQVTNFCDAVGAESEDVLRGMALDRRIGAGHMRPSPGWGGPCLQKDSLALLREGEKRGFDFSMVRAAVEANENQMNMVVEKVRASLGGKLQNLQIAVWGLTFKAETNDLRNSPAVEIVNRLVQSRAKVRAYDPAVTKDQPGLPMDIELCDNLYAVCTNAEVLVVLTEWEEFRTADFEKVAILLRSPSVVDGRNVLEPRELRKLNYSYVGLGRR